MKTSSIARGVLLLWALGCVPAEERVEPESENGGRPTAVGPCTADEVACGSACCGLDERCRHGHCELLPECFEPSPCPAGHRCDNSSMRIIDRETAAATRTDLVDYIWKGRGFPTTKMPASHDEVPVDENPIPNVGNVEKIERFAIHMPLTAAEGGGAFESHALHFAPRAKSQRLVVFHQGHTNQLSANGGAHTIRFFLERGVAVLALTMPLFGSNTGPEAFPTHAEMMWLESATRSPIQFFVEPIVVSLNFLELTHDYTDVSMIGISGGGWTTHLCAAVDPRIRHSIPVAGSLPIDMRQGPSEVGGEQTHRPLYESVAGYRDLYALGAFGEGRIQLQILNLYDSCCFGGTRYRAYENAVRAVARSLGGDFYVYLDHHHRGHMISAEALEAASAALRSEPVHVLNDGENGFGYVDSTFGDFHTIGPWTVSEGGFGGEQHRAPAEAQDCEAQWRFKGLDPGTYRISATWTPLPEGAADATYTISDGETDLESVSTNHAVAPVGFEQFGVVWQDLGRPHIIRGRAVEVRLASPAANAVVADAVRIERLALGPGVCR